MATQSGTSRRTRLLNDDVLPEEIRQRIREEYAQGPQRYSERWERNEGKRGPKVGAQRRAVG